MEKDVHANYEHRIVLIDDDMEEHEIFISSLQQLNYQIQNFTSARKALQYLHQLQRQDQPSVIVTDYEMPEMTGMEVLKSVKESPLLCHIPLIVYSSELGAGLRQQLKAKGAAGCFIKSDHPDDLKELLLVLGIVFENSVFN